MNRLKELRQEKKLSQKELAENIGVHYRTLQNWENGESQIKPDKAQQLADYFKVSVGYLLGYTNNPKLYSDEIAIEPEEGVVLTHSEQRNNEKLDSIRKKTQKQKDDFVNFLSENQFFLDNQTIDSILILIKNLDLDSSDPWRVKLSEMIVNDTLPADLRQKYSYIIDKGMY
ncbi:helix-turn-helix transcriptional regulator [Streptococcus anginosus]|uniref:helix-turn-helix domain-containing protein n=1 Tax=Streptococcus anginosus TaxID=1328 RepID=UPI00124691AC|nr:helix-turn-helix transcriptional regulator [Streptococcus anginosus]KAA9248181.1 helix-turn-helix transcriptional regulator [Streptococcus anginosus]KAA9309760.1 helix-turn-helix transcriptional regulator [Streptococcus anginosus]MED5944423.1 helix-turn-helix transcriptional regulator [Streptococcus anginosus]MED5959150.1 helix-turn-helix transcriptional regulator [Streptococcus anginosus]